MPDPLHQSIISLLRDATTIKALATVSKQGVPHVTVDPAITVDEKGNLLYLEFFENSESNVNLINSLWFKRQAAIYVTKQEESDPTEPASSAASWQIRGIPTHSVISGPLFEQCYREALAKDQEADLSTVWIIRPVEVIDESRSFKKQQQKENHPLIMHLDHLAK